MYKIALLYPTAEEGSDGKAAAERYLASDSAAAIQAAILPYMGTKAGNKQTKAHDATRSEDLAAKWVDLFGNINNTDNKSTTEK